MVVAAIVIPEVNIWFGISWISESEMALQCIISKEESLFLFRRLIIKILGENLNLLVTTGLNNTDGLTS